MACRDVSIIEFEAVIQAGTKSACKFVEFPHDVREIFHRSGSIPVRVAFNGMKSAGPLYPHGKDKLHILLLRKDVREALHVGPGDKVRVAVQVPAEVKKAASTMARSPPESAIAAVRPAVGPELGALPASAAGHKRPRKDSTASLKPAATGRSLRRRTLARE